MGNKGILPLKRDHEMKGAYLVQHKKPKEMQNQPQKFLFTEEMSLKCPQGLCYLCDEKYTPGHYLKHKTQLFLIQTEEDDDEEFIEEHSQSKEKGDTAQISMNAGGG